MKEFDLPTGIYGWFLPEEEPIQSSDDQNEKCECGAEIVYGKELQPNWHSDWCPKYEKIN